MAPLRALPILALVLGSLTGCVATVTGAAKVEPITAVSRPAAQVLAPKPATLIAQDPNGLRPPAAPVIAQDANGLKPPAAALIGQDAQGVKPPSGGGLLGQDALGLKPPSGGGLLGQDALGVTPPQGGQLIDTHHDPVVGAPLVDPKAGGGLGGFVKPEAQPLAQPEQPGPVRVEPAGPGGDGVNGGEHVATGRGPNVDGATGTVIDPPATGTPPVDPASPRF